jgi:hypothetical protein
MSKNKRHILSIFFILIMIIFALGSDDDEELRGVGFEADDTQFIITNNSPRDWNRVWLRINRAYELKLRRIRAGETVAVEMNKFILEVPKEERAIFGQKQRFDPLTMMPEEFSIWVLDNWSDNIDYYMHLYFSQEEGIWKKGLKPLVTDQSAQDD